jgi:hypothetical protein
MRAQSKANYSDPADKSTRLDENEHATQRGANAAVERGYGDPEYKGDATVKSPRGVSLDKTHGPQGDNARTQAIQQKVNSGQAVNITEEVDMPANAGFHAANERARNAGDPHISNPGSINRGTLEQMNKRWERGKQRAELPPPPAFDPAGALGSVGRAVVPGVAEGELALGSAAYLAAGSQLTAPLVTPLLTAAEALPVAAGVGVVGAGAGHAARLGAAALGADEQTANVVGFGTAILVGAALGSFIPGVGTVIGAAIGAIVAGAFYLWTL